MTGNKGFFYPSQKQQVSVFIYHPMQVVKNQNLEHIGIIKSTQEESCGLTNI